GFERGGVVETGVVIDPARVDAAQLDYLALGDWHSTKAISPRIWYSGTPETTDFRMTERGSILLVQIDGPGAVPSVERVHTSRNEWLSHRTDLHGPADIDALEAWFARLDEPLDTLVELELTGVLGLQDLSRLESVLERGAGRLLCLRQTGSGVLPSPSGDELDSIAAGGFIGEAIRRLKENADGGHESEDAARALQLLYRLSREGSHAD
ncbi:MAG: hypothetical protein KC561_14200, partial [Myxococcales bacterium]|nr:hypothetical protein [Myxococcales bacterium]